MKLNNFLTDKTLTAVELLPDNRLINVVLENGSIHGVEVEDMPLNAAVTRVELVSYEDDIITASTYTFTATDYTMLGYQEIVEE